MLWGLDQVDKLNIHSIDHIVMQAVNVPETIKFYTEILGMTYRQFQPPTEIGRAHVRTPVTS